MEEVLIVAVCLALNAVLAAYEMAFVSVPRSELRKLARGGVKEAQTLLKLRENPERTLSVIQIGITLVGALAAAVGGAGAAESIEPYLIRSLGLREVPAEVLAVVVVVIPLTYLSVVLGELVPKTLALRNPVGIVLKGARWLRVADRVLSPLVGILEGSTRQVLKTFFRKSKALTAGKTELTIELDALSPSHQQYVLNLAHIEGKRIKDILVPWTNVNSVRSKDAMEEVAPVVFSSGHTRLPVTEDNRVIGILHTKELLAFRETGATDWTTIVRPVLRIRAEDSVLGILRLMQERKSHMAVVLSQAGESLGIVTLEDILEEVVGDIYDEDDDGRIKKLFAARGKSRSLPKNQL